MGWFYGHTSRASLVKELTSNTEYLKTIARYFSGNDLWVVHADREGKFFICLYMLRRYDGDWGYKPVEASQGPTRASCPLKFLQMVPCGGGYETAWRWRVAQYWKQRKERLRKRRAWLDRIRKGTAYVIDQRGNVVT